MRIAVLGTGIMGAAMARNLARDGHEVRAWNRSPEKAEPLSADGIAVAHAPEDAARGAEVLVTMLLDADATTGPGGGGPRGPGPRRDLVAGRAPWASRAPGAWPASPRAPAWSTSTARCSARARPRRRDS
jgi:NAD(P)-dependent dehydrogenase (short-subunit alcohol dehydrogenase family)